MRFDVVSLFPEMFGAMTEVGVVSRAWGRGRWDVQFWNPRDFALDTYRRVDDRPFGGGPGMVMMAEPLAGAIEAAQRAVSDSARVLLMSPQGSALTHQRVQRWSERRERLVLVCGRYEGIDERVLEMLVDEEVSLGDFVLSGGEIAAMALMDAVIRLLPGVLHDEKSASQDSFAMTETGRLLDCPHYTRPEVWRDRAVPEVLLSGHHENIFRWRRQEALRATQIKRPDLIENARRERQLSSDDERFLSSLVLKKSGNY